MYGRQPNERIFSHSFGLLSPRSVIAIARIVGGMATGKRIERLDRRVYSLARFVGGHGNPRDGDGASPINHARDDDAQPVGERRRVYGEREAAGRPQRQDPSHQRDERGADVCPVGRWRGAVGAVAEPFAEALPDGGESAREVQGGDDGVLASAFGGYGSERSEGEPFGLRLREVRHGLSQRPVNLATFGWEAHGEPPAALLFFCCPQRCRKAARFPSSPARFRANLPLQAHKRRRDPLAAIHT